MNITKQSTLSEIVKDNFRYAEIFEKHNLDFCCRGKRPLDEACADKNLDVTKIIEELSNVKNGANVATNPDKWEIDFLIDYIVNTHHSYVAKMLPLISVHAQKVYNAHGKNHAEIREIIEKFEFVKNELELHMMKEEKMLFPYMKQLVRMKKENIKFRAAPFGTVSNPISVMEKEHENAGNSFFRIRELSNNYAPPEDACNTFTVFYEELKDFENDLHKHIHLENNILHIKAIKLEEGLKNKIN